MNRTTSHKEGDAPTTKVFISYAHRDAGELATRLHRDLTRKGVFSWLDTSRIDAGASWSAKIEDALDGSDVVLALLSTASFYCETCRGEQLRAMRKNKCVIPVLVHRNADRPVYLESSHYLDFSEANSYEELLEQLSSHIDHREGAVLPQRYLKTDYETVPPLPENYVERLDALAPLRNSLIADSTQQVRLVAARGMGGVGKTVLAQAICRRDEMIQAVFPDGICWVTIGQQPGNLVSQMVKIARVLGESTVGFDSPEESKERLRAILRTKAALIVLDDVWDANCVEVFRAEASRCKILFTTRDSRVAIALGALEYYVDMLNVPQARELLARYAGTNAANLPPEADEVVKECGRLPLALAMSGAMVRLQSGRWESVLHKLRAANPAKILQQFPNYPYPDLLKTIQVSIDALDSKTRQRYKELAVFPEDVQIPPGALEVLWQCDDIDAQDTSSCLVAASLAVDVRQRLTLHDLNRDVLRMWAGEAGLYSLHTKLLDAYAARCNGWPSGPNDGYFFEHLVHHLSAVGRGAELRRLLLDLDWMKAKLQNTNVNSLVSDYDLVQADPEVSLVQSALRMSISVLAEDSTQLAGQLYGRLLSHKGLKITELLARIRTVNRSSWLRPMSASMLPAGGPMALSLRPPSQISAIAVTNDGSKALTGHVDGGVTIWDLKNGTELQTMKKHNVRVQTIAVTPDGETALTQFADGRITFWHLPTTEDTRTVSEGQRVLVLTPCGKYAVTDLGWGTAKIWELDGDDSIILAGHDGFIHAAAITPDGTKIITASDDKTVRIWDRTNGEQLKVLTGHQSWVTAVTSTPDGKSVITGSKDKTSKIWSLVGHEAPRTLSGHEAWVRAVAITTDGKRVFTASEDGTVRIWDKSTGKMLRKLIGHVGPICSMALVPNGEYALTSSIDGTLKIWNLQDTEVQVERESHSRISLVTITADNTQAATYSDDGTLKLWEIGNCQEKAALNINEGVNARRKDAIEDLEAGAIAINQDGSLTIVSFFEEIQFWDLRSGKRARKKLKMRGGISRMILAEKQNRLIVVRVGYSGIVVLDLSSGSKIRTLFGSVKSFSSSETDAILEFSDDVILDSVVTPDAEKIITLSISGTVKVWDLSTGKQVKVLVSPSGKIERLPGGLFRMQQSDGTVVEICITSDGEQVLTINQAGTGKFWSCETWELESEHDIPSDQDGMVVTRPKGEYRYVTVEERTIRWWDLASQKVFASLTLDYTVSAWSVTSDGLIVVAGDDSGALHSLQLDHG